MVLSLRRTTKFVNEKFRKTLVFTTLLASPLWMFSSIPSQAVAFSFTQTTDTQTSTQTSIKTGFDHESTDLIADVLYLRPSSTYQDMATSGAYRVNQDYALGLTNEWYIEEQRFGADALISGILHDDPLATDAGLKIFDWGFAQQQADGSFGDTGDAFHSTSLFIQSVAYALLTLQESPVGDQYTDIIEQYTLQLQDAAHWMIREDIWEHGLEQIAPYTHRYYIIAAALGLTGKLTDDQTLIDHADRVITTGLEQQHSDGVNPEKGGHDSSYQMAGSLYAMRWLTHFPTDPLAPDVAKMLDKALLWEDSVILETGAISSEGNTRTEGQYLTREGETKQINHREVIHGFAYWFSMTEESIWETNALQVANYYYADDPQVTFVLNQIENSIASPVPPLHSDSDQLSQPIPEPSSTYGLLIFGILFFMQKRKIFSGPN